jgi:hypothetical protein
MKKRTMLPILVVALGLMVWSAPIVYGAQSLTVNGQPLDSITLEVGQSCTVEVVSDDSTSYEKYVGFDNGVVLGDFSHYETKPQACDDSRVARYETSAFYGYYIRADCSYPGGPSPGVHFIFEYEAQQVGETDVKLYDNTFASVIDLVHINVIPKPMGKAFTFQGSLNDAGSPADGLYDFEFKLYDSIDGGNQEGNKIDINDIDVIAGQFTAELDFGNEPNIFNGYARWLQVGVRPGDSNEVYTVLSPRIELMPTPYALYAKAAGGDGDWKVSGDDMYAIPSGTVSVWRSHDAVGPGLEVRRYIPGIGQHTRMEIDSDSIDTYRFNLPHTSGATLGLNSNSGGNVILAGGGGSVGIGTIEPTSKLHVVGTIEVDQKIQADDSGGLELATDEGTTRLKISDNGNVGIGTTNPQSKLSVGGDGIANTGVYGSGAVYGVYGNGPYGVFGEGSNYGVSGKDSDTGSYGRLGFSTYGGYFSGDGYFSGNVGIGTASPQCKLDVGGSVAVSNSMTIQGKVVIGEPTTVSAQVEIVGPFRGKGLYAKATGLGSFGVVGETEGVGAGVKGIASYSGDLPTFGGYFEAFEGRNGVGVYAKGGQDGYAAEFIGNVRIGSHSTGLTVMELGEGLDYAEGFDVCESTKIDAGSVLIIDAENPGKLAISDKPYDSKVAGIVAGAKCQGSGVRLGAGQFDYDVALAGRVYCNVDATEAGVEPGDLLTTSATPGYAMKSTDYARAQGAILGKAMESLEKGQKGQILVLVTLQ